MASITDSIASLDSNVRSVFVCPNGTGDQEEDILHIRNVACGSMMGDSNTLELFFS